MLYRDTHLLCPKCGVELEHRGALGRRFRGCAECNGLFLEHAVLADMYREMAGAAPTLGPDLLDRPRKRPCPVCQQRMKNASLEQIPVDHCAEHGVWFDGSELPEVLFRLAGDG